MKRVISFIILFIISSTIIFSTGEYGAVRGKISGGKAVIYNMRNIYLELKDETGSFINSAYIQPSRDFYFFNVKNGKYVLEVTTQGDTKRFLFEKKFENVYIGEVNIEIGESAIQKNLLLNLLFGITALVNFIIIFIIRRGNEFESKRKIISTLYIYNLGYVVMFSGFLLSFFEKDFSYLLIPISYFIWDILMIMLLIFFMEYPVKNKSKLVNIVSYIIIFFKIIFALFLLLDRYYSNIFLLFDVFKDSRVMAGSADIMYYLSAASDIVIAGFIAIILIKNIKNRRGSIEGLISRFFSKTLIVTIPILIVADILIRILWPGRFEGYSEIAHSIFNLIVMMIILLGVSGAKMLYGRKKNTVIFREVIKYYIFMLFLYGIIIFYENITFAFLMMGGVLLKAFMDYITSYFIRKYKINYEKLISKLEAIIEPNEFFKVLADEAALIMECKSVEIITRNSESEEKFEKIEKSENQVIFGESLKLIFKSYDIGVKIEENGKTKAVMLIGEKNSGKNIEIKDINFLLHFSQDISKLMSNMSLKVAKKILEAGKEKSSEANKTTESIMYIQKIAEIISETTGEDKTKKLIETILKELKKARGEICDERD